MGNFLKGMAALAIGTLIADAIAKNTFLKKECEKEEEQNKRLTSAILKRMEGDN